jgi:hypothetical protein
LVLFCLGINHYKLASTADATTTLSHIIMILLYVKLDYSHNNNNNNNVTTILPLTLPLLLTTWQVQVVEETIIDKIKMRLL